MKRRTRLLIVMELLVLVFLPTAVLANDSAMNDGAYGPEPLGWRPGAESVIRMCDEKLTIDFSPRSSAVRVVFTFANTSIKPVRQPLGFPDLSAANEEAKGYNRGGFNIIGPIEDMITYVDGKQVRTERQTGFVSGAVNGTWEPATPETGEAMAWWTVWVDFPPGDTVTVERHYRVRNAEAAPDNPADNPGYAWFQYLTATGAAWQGTIGSLTADVFLQDGLTVDDLGGRGGVEHSAAQGWQQVSNTHLRLQWYDFEPALDRERRYFEVGIRSIVERTPEDQLLYAARTGDEMVPVAGLLTDTALVNCWDAVGRTPIWWAVTYNRIGLTRDLLAAGADPGMADFDGMTPLMVAAQHGFVNLAEILLERGANPAARDMRRISARDYALFNGWYEIVRLFPDEPPLADLNAASAEQIMAAIPRMTQATADAIVAARGTVGGRFARWDQVDAVRGVGQSTLAKLQTSFVLGPGRIGAAVPNAVDTIPSEGNMPAEEIDPAPAVERPSRGLPDLNTASIEQLDATPGINRRVAERIVAARETNGRFANWDQVNAVRGVGDATLARLQAAFDLK